MTEVKGKIYVVSLDVMFGLEEVEMKVLSFSMEVAELNKIKKGYIL